MKKKKKKKKKKKRKKKKKKKKKKRKKLRTMRHIHFNSNNAFYSVSFQYDIKVTIRFFVCVFLNILYI